MQLTTKEAIKLMNKLGFEMVDCKHHVRGFLTVDGKKIFPVHCSHGSKDLPGPVPHRFRASLHLNLEEFEVLRSCVIDREAYLKILIEKGVVHTGG